MPAMLSYLRCWSLPDIVNLTLKQILVQETWYLGLMLFIAPSATATAHSIQKQQNTHSSQVHVEHFPELITCWATK